MSRQAWDTTTNGKTGIGTRQFTFSWNKNKIIELCKEWYNPITEETITMNRLQISKLGRAKFILKEGGSMGDLYSTTDLRATTKATSRSTRVATSS